MNRSKILLISPGAGNPESDLYRQVYELIGTMAQREGYSNVDTSIRWPGQASSPFGGDLTFDGAVAVLARKLSELDAAKTPYDLLGRSFGCPVALRAAEVYRPTHLGRILLWGAVPHWKVWELFVESLDTAIKKGAEKGVTISARFYSSCIPVEILLQRCRFRVRFALGSADSYMSAAFSDYLKTDLCAKNPLVVFPRAVPDAPHEITAGLCEETITLYRTALFGG